MGDINLDGHKCVTDAPLAVFEQSCIKLVRAHSCESE